MDILNSIDQCIINNYDEDFFQLYLFSNENIGDYKSYFDLNGKSLLTVGSSIDQVINASLDNCSNITICDICPLTKYFYYLKDTVFHGIIFNDMSGIGVFASVFVERIFRGELLTEIMLCLAICFFGKPFCLRMKKQVQ